MSYKACTNTKCESKGGLLPETAFSKRKERPVGLRSRCRACLNKAKRAYRKKNPELHKTYYLNNKRQHKKYGMKYQKDHRQEINEYLKEWKKTNKNYILRNRLRSRISKALSGERKTSSSLELLGVTSVATVHTHLKKNFKPGMSWKNRQKWEIDHIIPLSIFDLSNSLHQKIACHYTNLQPLWAEDNLSKGATVPANFNIDTYIEQKRVELDLQEV